MELKCSVQNYAWGKIGLDSEVAKLSESSGLCDDLNKPYAELWMGTHPSGPSTIIRTGEKLSEWLEENPDALGEKVLKKFGLQLPYLFKVLSVNKSLSIQAHPNKGHAEQLHHDFPDIYKDSNHKPEMAIALSPFEALCGFRPLGELKNFLQVIPELQEVVGEENVSVLLTADEANTRQALKACFTALMTCSIEKMKLQLQHLYERISAMEESSRPDILGELFLRLFSQYPGDVGCFGIYFFNYLTLQPGEAMFLGPNEPHAYLLGDCIECMACSDNVVRAGLTSKFIDVSTLCEMLTYDCGTAEEKKFQGKKEDDFTTLFKPPVPDFAVAEIDIPEDITSYTLISRDSASILIIIIGSGFDVVKEQDESLKKGKVIFVPANEDITIYKTDSRMLLFQACCSLD